VLIREGSGSITRAQQAPQSERPAVLVVDDEIAIVKVLRDFLFTDELEQRVLQPWVQHQAQQQDAVAGSILREVAEPERAPLELGMLLRQTAEGVQPLAAARGISLALEAPAEPCPLLGDGHLLARAVANETRTRVRQPRGPSRGPLPRRSSARCWPSPSSTCSPV
jgi:signal transduction histidine kinase